MSYSSMKNLPNPFAPGRLQKFGQTLRQPIAIAVFASLAVHGLLAYGLPYMTSSKSDKPEDQRPVNVVELSPLERTRLPQTDPLPGFAPLPKTTQSKTTDPLGSVGVPLNPYALAPDSSSNYTIPPETPTLKERSILDRSDSSDAKRKSPSSKTAKDRPSKDEKGEKSGADDLKGTKDRTLDDKQLQALYAFNAAGTTDAEWQSNVTSALTAIATTYQDKIAEGFGTEKPLKIEAPYPKSACQFKHNNEAIQGQVGLIVVTNLEGKPDSKPIIFRSSGFPGLNEAAVNYVIDHPWKAKPSDKFTPYQLVVNFAPKEADCAAANPPGSPAPGESPKS